MRIVFLWVLLLPCIAFAQSKKKLAKQEQAANAALTAALKNHVQYLADDKLEGRRTGTKGEEMAMDYIVQQYQQAGIAPQGSNGNYPQPFVIKEGKQIQSNTLALIEGKPLQLQQHFFPLAFSANSSINSSCGLQLNEAGRPFSIDVKEWLDENQNNPHFDVEDAVKKYAVKAASKGAVALLVYNSGNAIDNLQFNKNDNSILATIPIVYITKEGLKQFFTPADKIVNINITVNIKNQERSARNIIAYIDNKATNTVIIGAHYDHLGFGEDKNALDALHEVHNGADDNASGTAALIELGKMLKNSPAKNNNYLLMHFSGEELGLYGSKYWIENPTLKITPNYMINMDMVGRYDTAKKLTIGGYGTSPSWRDIFETTTNNLVLKFDSSGSGPSDHASFYRANIPVLFFFTGSHADYHKTTDDWDKINYDGQRQIVQYIYKLIQTADNKGKFAFAKTNEPQMGRSTRFTVSLGVIPDYGYTGIGVKIDGVSAGKLAEKLGLQANDVLLQLGDYKFADVNNYMQALSKFKKGDATKLTIKRGDKEFVFDVVF
jgi:aminopeptidase YwaD